MKRSARLEPVLAVARQKSQQGLQAVAYIQTRLDEERAKLEQLRHCQEEYRFSNIQHEKQTVSVITLQSMRQFSANVEIAMQQQARQIEAVESQLGKVREAWKQLDARSQSLQKTQLKIRKEELELEQKLEQKQLDEMITQKFSQKGGFGGF